MLGGKGVNPMYFAQLIIKQQIICSDPNKNQKYAVNNVPLPFLLTYIIYLAVPARHPGLFIDSGNDINTSTNRQQCSQTNKRLIKQKTGRGDSVLFMRDSYLQVNLYYY